MGVQFENAAVQNHYFASHIVTQMEDKQLGSCHQATIHDAAKWDVCFASHTDSKRL
jgi:hypothetical protein